MAKEFVPYKQALELKNLGYDNPCLALWSTDTYKNIPKLKRFKAKAYEKCINSFNSICM